jgi:hypothetical protein
LDKKKTKKKLELKRQGVRQLTPAEMSQAAGGIVWTTTVTVTTVIIDPEPAH